MKKLLFTALALPLLVVCCTKDISVQTGNRPSLVTVTEASDGMMVSASSVSAGEAITVRFTVAGADSIQWSMSDSTGYPGDTTNYPGNGDTTTYPPTYPGDTTTYPGNNDTVIYNPPYPGDTTVYNPGGNDTTIYNPGDTTVYNPGDTLNQPQPPHDSTIYNPPYPNDTTGNGGYYPDSTGIHGGHTSGDGYIMITHDGYVEIKVSKRGSYTLTAKAYHRNADGSYTLIKTGHVKMRGY